MTVLVSVASRLRAAGMPDPGSLSPKQLAWEARRRADDDRTDLYLAAVAAAVGTNGDKAAWKAIAP